jgi:hypothetical protein
MLVYADRSRTLDPRDLLTSVSAAVAAAADEPAGWERQDRLRAALIAAGELAQGLADAAFDAAGCDDDTPPQAAALALAVAIARRLARAWRDPAAPVEPPTGEAAALGAFDLPPQVTCKTPEGYAFYAVYPESYLAAVAGEVWNPPPAVIGLRSIGTGLAAAVAAQTGASLAVTLRPFGDPFRRQVRVSQHLADRLAAHPGVFVVVDEGPGLSGSSFGAAADLLEGLGVAPERIVFAPSHGGDLGGKAAERHRLRWRRARRLVSTLDDLAAAEPLARWFADLIGDVEQVEDISGGLWARGEPAGRRPPVWAAQERRKFRLIAASGTYVARFAGLGGIGQAKFEQAKALHAAGFTAKPLGLRRGFLLERWEQGARLDVKGPDRERLLEQLARYLAFRANRFPAAAEDGASFDQLRGMAIANALALGGEALGAAVAERLGRAGDIARELRPVRVDGRLQTWEWLRRKDGAPIKTDALDHAAGHDLIGCQDIAWDVAGAASEWRLSPGEIDELAAAVSRRSGSAVGPAAVEAFRICYAAFQAAYWAMAAEGATESEPSALRAWRDRHLDDLRRLAHAR